MRRFLVVDDDPPLLLIMSRVLRGEGREVMTAPNGAAALALIHRTEFDVILTDLSMQPMDGLQLLEAVRRLGVQTPVVFMTACDSVETAMRAMKGGAFDYVVKPLRIAEVQATVGRALEYHDRLVAPAAVADTAGLRLQKLVAVSPALREACALLERLALTDATIFLSGEAGTGRRFAAAALHAASHRRDKPYLEIACHDQGEERLAAELLDGGPRDGNAFLSAAGGTLMLHEVGALSPSLQNGIFRVLSDRRLPGGPGRASVPIDVRVLATSSELLSARVERGAFHAGLYNRLSLITVTFPPLRERREDIVPLAGHFLGRESARLGRPLALDPEAQSMIESYPWPGNVRELENAMRAAAASVKGPTVACADLPPAVLLAARPGAAAAAAERRLVELRGKSFSTFIRGKERSHIQTVVDEMDGDLERAARALGITRTMLERKLNAPPAGSPPSAS